MIVDSHCHTWRDWPYAPPYSEPAPPWPETAARVEHLIYEMDKCGVDAALVVADNNVRDPANSRYVAEALTRYPGRLYEIGDVSDIADPRHYHAEIVERLERLSRETPLVGLTYRAVWNPRFGPEEDDLAWLVGPVGDSLLAFMSEHGYVLSLALPIGAHANLRKAAQKHPECRFLLHHMAELRFSDQLGGHAWTEVERTSEIPNIHLKYSGFYSAASVFWQFPHSEVWAQAERLVELFGASRLHWGSDYPMCLRGVQYVQSLEVVRSQLPFPSEEARAEILGDSLVRWLGLGKTSRAVTA
jgi:predicted TIM-barrel fold metal-dependent hydrolase